MTMINPATGWFKIIEIPKFGLDEVAVGNDEYIDKSPVRVVNLVNNTWLCIYPRPRKVVFGNGSGFKRDFTTLLKDFDIKPILTTIKIPQANAMVEWVQQEILNMLVTKDIDNRVFGHIDTWGETLAYISWDIRASYHRTIMSTPGQDIFGRYMLFNLASVVDRLVVTAEKYRQVDIDKCQRKLQASHA